MTTRRRLLLLALPTVAGLVAGGWLLGPRTAITRENAATIELGMTLAEVEAILGGPARDESTEISWSSMPAKTEDIRGPVPSDFDGCGGVRERDWRWLSDYAHVLIGPTADSRVKWIVIYQCEPYHESPIDMIRRRLRL